MSNTTEPRNPPPPDWPRISTALWYQDAAQAIDWLCAAFGFAVRLKIEGDDGSIEHSELTYGEGLVMVGDVRKAAKFPQVRSPRQLDGANTQCLMVYVDDVEAHFARAKAAGATIVTEPKVSDYGEDYWSERGYECADLDGHHWWFYQRLRTAPKAPSETPSS